MRYKTTHTLWQTLLKAALEADGYEISCEQCFNLLVLYAEVLEEGGNSAEIITKVKQHLKQWGHCSHEVEALIGKMHEFGANDHETGSPFSPE